jgi:hypothetical protein
MAQTNAKPSEGVSGCLGFIVMAVIFVVMINSCKSTGSGSSGMPWSDTVQGQYCSDPYNGAVAEGISEGTGESYNTVCTKLWAVDKYLSEEPVFDPNAEYDPFAP